MTEKQENTNIPICKNETILQRPVEYKVELGIQDDSLERSGAVENGDVGQLKMEIQKLERFISQGKGMLEEKKQALAAESAQRKVRLKSCMGCMKICTVFYHSFDVMERS